MAGAGGWAARAAPPALVLFDVWEDAENITNRTVKAPPKAGQNAAPGGISRHSYAVGDEVYRNLTRLGPGWDYNPGEAHVRRAQRGFISKLESRQLEIGRAVVRHNLGTGDFQRSPQGRGGCRNPSRSERTPGLAHFGRVAWHSPGRAKRPEWRPELSLGVVWCR